MFGGSGESLGCIYFSHILQDPRDGAQKREKVSKVECAGNSATELSKNKKKTALYKSEDRIKALE